VYFQVRDTDGTLIVGDDLLPLPPEDLRTINKDIFFDATYHGELVRVASIYLPVPNDNMHGQVLVQVAETLVKRTRLARELLFGVTLFGLVLISLSAASIWIGIGRALAPLTRIRDAIQNRPPKDIGPVPEDTAPTEVRPLLHAINHMLGQLAKTMAVQQRFIADAAHQLRTPLAGIKTQADYAQREKDPVAVQHALRQISASVDRTSHLAQQLLSLARAEAAQNGPPSETIDLNDILRSTTSDWVPRAVHKDIDLGYDGPTRPRWIRGDALLLREMLNNLLDNAIRYSPPGSKVTVALGDDHEPVISVEDSGPGIPPDEHQHVFERFHRVIGTPGDGSGLGLALVREIAGLHGGDAWISTPACGRGTRVNVKLAN
jgi:two-component system sensor histidine kinase TctE